MTPAQECDAVVSPATSAEQPSLLDHAIERARPQAEGVPPGVTTLDSTWLALTVSLACVGIVGKFMLLPFPVSTLGEFVRWVLRLAVISSPDICFAAGLATVCWFIAYTLRWWPTFVRRTWRWSSIGLFACCAVYAVASVPMFKVTKVPFTVRLLSFVGGPEVMASSAGQYFPPGIVALLVLCPVAVILAPAIARRPFPRRLVALVGWKMSVCLLAAVVAGGVACERYVKAEWTDPNRWERRIAHSPHWVLISSCIEELSKDRPFTHTYSFDEIDDSDFRKPKRQSPPTVPLLPAENRPKNVILIVLESTGVDYFGTHGSRYATTPNIDRRAAEQGVVFDNVYAQAASSCKSLVALSNSVYPRPDWLLIARDHPQFDVVSLPQVLKEHGYRTCYAHSGYWAWQKRDRFLKARGVDAVLDASSHPGRQINSWGIDDQTMYQDLLDWIDAEPTKPFFAFAYTIETHHPYHPPKEHYDFGVEDEEKARYLDALRAADAKIAWLIDQLENRGLADSTLIAVTADHGESFGEHNQRTHSFGIYEQTVHVPLVLMHSSLKGLSRHNANMGRHIDIAPTLLDVLNIPAPEVWQGVSLFRDRDEQRAYFLSVGNEVVLGLRDGRYKYHYYVDTEQEELFDVEADRAELQNLATAEAERAREYRSRLGGWVTYQREFLAKHGVR
jgi:phosphoglycerol transferase MdoB-like AlkP superfamily enzyme